MERWEPPVGMDRRAARRERREKQKANRRLALPEALELSAGRIVVAFAFMVPFTLPVPENALLVFGPLLVLALGFLAFLVKKWGAAISRQIWASDVVSLGLVVPVMVINAFAGGGNDALRPDESTTYVQTFSLLVILLGALFVYAIRLAPPRSGLWGIVLLPAALSIVSISTAYGDFRENTVAGVVAIAWLVAAIGTILTRLTFSGVALYLPFITLMAFIVVSRFVWPELFSLGGRPSPVSALHPLLFFLAALSLLAAPLAQYGNANGGPKRSRRATVRR